MTFSLTKKTCGYLESKPLSFIDFCTTTASNSFISSGPRIWNNKHIGISMTLNAFKKNLDWTFRTGLSGLMSLLHRVLLNRCFDFFDCLWTMALKSLLIIIIIIYILPCGNS